MDTDKGYWEKYYESGHPAEEPSFFARYILEHHVEPGHSLIELGCGNGRDSLFLAQHGIKVHAVDQSENAISLIERKNPFPHLTLEVGDFTNLGKREPVDHIYSRFTLHTITEKEEDRIIAWAAEHLREGGKLLIEARGQKNELYKLGKAVSGEEHAYVYDDHYRRFISIDALKKKLQTAGFDIILAEEAQGFAPLGNTDQHFIRMIAIKRAVS